MAVLDLGLGDQRLIQQAVQRRREGMWQRKTMARYQSTWRKEWRQKLKSREKALLRLPTASMMIPTGMYIYTHMCMAEIVDQSCPKKLNNVGGKKHLIFSFQSWNPKERMFSRLQMIFTKRLKNHSASKFSSWVFPPFDGAVLHSSEPGASFIKWLLFFHWVAGWRNLRELRWWTTWSWSGQQRMHSIKPFPSA